MKSYGRFHPNVQLHPTWPILFDGNQFTTILTNLFANAVDAMKGSRGVLTIGLKNITIKAEDFGEHDQVPPGPFPLYSAHHQ